jgi:N-acetyl-gamma-glutamyl-phosphate/LysW-gamma-L-alpha-aminoadipyl-6-phosphate reductase
MGQKMKISIVGASGYAGGELLRILLFHPKVEIQQVTSLEFVGQSVSVCHPNLRKITNLRFSKTEDLKPCDLLFIAIPNGKSMGLMKKFIKIASHIIDAGADFRLRSAEEWKKWYHTDHLAPELIGKFIYGVPEIHKEEIKKAKYVAGPGCEAIVSILSLWPLIKNDLIEKEKIIIDAKIGSSASGSAPTLASHHPERRGVARSYMPTGHRHTAEIEQELTIDGKKPKILISATAIEMVRGILVTIQTFLKKEMEEKEIWKVYFNEYKDDPFIRIVKEQQGIYRYPEPKILQGTNFCEIGFEKDKLSNRLVVMGAIDNLVKGTAGNAVQCMNLMFGFKETLGLEFPGLHPI